MSLAINKDGVYTTKEYKYMKFEVPLASQDREPKNTFAEQFQDFWREHYPEAFERNHREYPQLYTESQKREQAIADKDISAVLEAFDYPNVDIEHKYTIIEYIEYQDENGEEIKTPVPYDQVYEISLPARSKSDNTLTLPEGYAYSGGAARSELLRALNIDSSYQPRDRDVLRLVSEEPKPGLDHEISKEFMPDDYEHGYGVQYLDNEQDYFITRDLSQNEVLADQKTVKATRTAILDTARHIIRPTRYERNEFDGSSSDKMLSKILRFYSLSIQRYDHAALADIEGWEFEEGFISPFWCALGLDRAYEVSPQAAEIFTRKLRDHGQIPGDIETVRDAAFFLGGLVHDFEYRHAPTEQFKTEDRWANEFGEDFEESLSKDRKKY